jgi:hypothetical protein
MELKPSTYYLDAIKERAKQRELALQQEAKEVSEETTKAAERARVQEEKASEEIAKRRIEAHKAMISSSSASMWGSDRSIVELIKNNINDNLEAYVENPEQFQAILASLDAFVDHSKEYHSRTVKSFSDATIRATPGAKNPYEERGFMDGNDLKYYEDQARSLDSPIGYEVKISETGDIVIGEMSISEYVGKRSGDGAMAEPFAPALERLPALTAEELYNAEKGGLLALPAEKRKAGVGKIMDDVLGNPVKTQRMMQGTGWSPSMTTGDALIQKQRDKIEQDLIGLLGQGQ